MTQPKSNPLQDCHALLEEVEGDRLRQIAHFLLEAIYYETSIETAKQGIELYVSYQPKNKRTNPFIRGFRTPKPVPQVGGKQKAARRTRKPSLRTLPDASLG